MTFCSVMNNIAESDLPNLPAYLTTQYAVAVAIQERSLSYLQVISVSADDLSRPIIEVASGKIINVIGGPPARLLEDVRTRFAAIRCPPLSQDGGFDAEFLNLFGDLPVDFWQLLQSVQATGPLDHTFDTGTGGHPPFDPHGL